MSSCWGGGYFFLIFSLGGSNSRSCGLFSSLFGFFGFSWDGISESRTGWICTGLDWDYKLLLLPLLLLPRLEGATGTNNNNAGRVGGGGCTYILSHIQWARGKLGVYGTRGAGWLDNLDPEDLFYGRQTAGRFTDDGRWIIGDGCSAYCIYTLGVVTSERGH